MLNLKQQQDQDTRLGNILHILLGVFREKAGQVLTLTEMSLKANATQAEVQLLIKRNSAIFVEVQMLGRIGKRKHYRLAAGLELAA